MPRRRIVPDEPEEQAMPVMHVLSKPSSDGYYHFDKSAIALIGGLIFSLLLQTGTFIWWASGLTAAVRDQDRRLVNIEVWREKQTDMAVQIGVLANAGESRQRALDALTAQQSALMARLAVVEQHTYETRPRR